MVAKPLGGVSYQQKPQGREEEAEVGGAECILSQAVDKTVTMVTHIKSKQNMHIILWKYAYEYVFSDPDNAFNDA